MEEGQKVNIPLSSPVDTHTSDMLVPLSQPTFAHNRQKWQGNYLPTSLRYELDGWAADRQVYSFDADYKYIELGSLFRLHASKISQSRSQYLFEVYYRENTSSEYQLVGNLFYNAASSALYNTGSGDVSVTADGTVTGSFNGYNFRLTVDHAALKDEFVSERDMLALDDNNTVHQLNGFNVYNIKDLSTEEKVSFVFFSGQDMRLTGQLGDTYQLAYFKGSSDGKARWSDNGNISAAFNSSLGGLDNKSSWSVIWLGNTVTVEDVSVSSTEPAGYGASYKEVLLTVGISYSFDCYFSTMQNSASVGSIENTAYDEEQYSATGKLAVSSKSSGDMLQLEDSSMLNYLSKRAAFDSSEHVVDEVSAFYSEFVWGDRRIELPYIALSSAIESAEKAGSLDMESIYLRLLPQKTGSKEFSNAVNLGEYTIDGLTFDVVLGERPLSADKRLLEQQSSYSSALEESSNLRYIAYGSNNAYFTGSGSNATTRSLSPIDCFYNFGYLVGCPSTIVGGSVVEKNLNEKHGAISTDSDNAYLDNTGLHKLDLAHISVADATFLTLLGDGSRSYLGNSVSENKLDTLFGYSAAEDISSKLSDESSIYGDTWSGCGGLFGAIKSASEKGPLYGQQFSLTSYSMPYYDYGNIDEPHDVRNLYFYKKSMSFAESIMARKYYNTASSIDDVCMHIYGRKSAELLAQVPDVMGFTEDALPSFVAFTGSGTTTASTFTFTKDMLSDIMRKAWLCISRSAGLRCCIGLKTFSIDRTCSFNFSTEHEDEDGDIDNYVYAVSDNYGCWKSMLGWYTAGTDTANKYSSGKSGYKDMRQFLNYWFTMDPNIQNHLYIYPKSYNGVAVKPVYYSVTDDAGFTGLHSNVYRDRCLTDRFNGIAVNDGRASNDTAFSNDNCAKKYSKELTSFTALGYKIFRMYYKAFYYGEMHPDITNSSTAHKSTTEYYQYYFTNAHKAVFPDKYQAAIASLANGSYDSYFIGSDGSVSFSALHDAVRSKVQELSDAVQVPSVASSKGLCRRIIWTPARKGTELVCFPYGSGEGSIISSSSTWNLLADSKNISYENPNSSSENDELLKSLGGVQSGYYQNSTYMQTDGDADSLDMFDIICFSAASDAFSYANHRLFIIFCMDNIGLRESLYIEEIGGTYSGKDDSATVSGKTYYANAFLVTGYGDSDIASNIGSSRLLNIGECYKVMMGWHSFTLSELEDAVGSSRLLVITDVDAYTFAVQLCSAASRIRAVLSDATSAQTVSFSSEALSIGDSGFSRYEFAAVPLKLSEYKSQGSGADFALFYIEHGDTENGSKVHVAAANTTVSSSGNSISIRTAVVTDSSINSTAYTDTADTAYDDTAVSDGTGTSGSDAK